MSSSNVRGGRSPSVPAPAWVLVVAFAFPFVLLGAPRTFIRLAGAPLYLVDGLAVLVSMAAISRPAPRATRSTVLVRGALLFLASVLMSEAYGALLYGVFMEPVYIAARYTLGVGLVLSIPRLFSYRGVPEAFFLGLAGGVGFSGLVTLGMSLPGTREFFLGTFIDNPILNPVAAGERGLGGLLAQFQRERAIRGSSLIGTSTITAGFLGTAWPLALVCTSQPGWGRASRLLGRLAVILGPVGLLATYGRAAWAMALVGVATLGALGSGGGRRAAFMLLGVVAAIASLVGQSEEYTMMDRLANRTQAAVYNPLEGESERERFQSFVEPLSYLMEHPSWLFLGPGRAGERLARVEAGFHQAFDEGALATHSGFAMSVYAFGLPGLAGQVFYILGVYFLIASHIIQPRAQALSYLVFWRIGLAAMNGYMIWWGAGHAPVGTPRAVMVSFLLGGCLAAGDAVSEP